MLNPDLCPRTDNRWVALTSFVSHAFTKSASGSLKFTAIALLILGCLGLFWLTQRPSWRRFWRRFRWNRQLTRMAIALTLICLLVTSPPGVALANEALVKVIPMTSDATADAIVVLGRGPTLRTNRVEVAAALWRLKRAPKIFVSGRGDALSMIQQLKEKGVDAQAIDGDECSMTTEENAKFTAAELIPQGVKKILLVTDPPHMLRSQLTFNSLGFEVSPFASTLPPGMGYRETAAIVFREYGGLVSYILQGRFIRREES